MNGLSLVFLLAELSGNIRVVSGIVASVGGIGLIIMFIMLPIVMDTEFTGFSKESVKNVIKSIGITVGICLGVLVIVPGKQTIFLIGASQAGEQILALEEVQEVGGEAGALATDTIKLLRQMVGEQIKGDE